MTPGRPGVPPHVLDGFAAGEALCSAGYAGGSCSTTSACPSQGLSHCLAGVRPEKEPQMVIVDCGTSVAAAMSLMHRPCSTYSTSCRGLSGLLLLSALCWLLATQAGFALAAKSLGPLRFVAGSGICSWKAASSVRMSLLLSGGFQCCVLGAPQLTP